jgi:hypothetical protein
MNVSEVHPRNPETGQIDGKMDADEFVTEYIRENSTFPRIANLLL